MPSILKPASMLMFRESRGAARSAAAPPRSFGHTAVPRRSAAHRRVFSGGAARCPVRGRARGWTCGWARLLGRLQHAAAAVLRAAAARIDILDVGVVVVVTLNL